MEIKIDDLSDGRVIHLLNQHLKEMHKYSPVESIHALDEEKLRDLSVTFWSAYIDDELAGCGALKELSPSTGEIKSMKTSANHLRKGVAAEILAAIIKEAQRRNYQSLSLETGTNVAFNPAVELYKKHGFIECEPFADYQPDPYSQFFTKKLF